MDFCYAYYTTEYWKGCYLGIIHPHGSAKAWDIPVEVKQFKLLPPHFNSRPAGRPKKRRILSQGEVPSGRKCSRCGKEGHNRKTCDDPVPLSQRSSR
ncbi:MAG: hypothetical protein EOP45_16000 [Sphingobacteriaceae bacterium]|nr:MAG: hypothetical protein EOP45_16000 [Sphingobacteriaceae bacterium]